MLPVDLPAAIGFGGPPAMSGALLGLPQIQTPGVKIIEGATFVRSLGISSIGLGHKGCSNLGWR